MKFEEMYPTMVKEDEAGYQVDDNEDPGSEDLSGDEELFNAIKSLVDSKDEDEEDDSEDADTGSDADDDESEDDEEEQDDEEADEDDEQEEEEVEEKPAKKQSKEDNAKFAAQRRQRELDAKVQAELERLRNESPEFQLAKQLSEMYGKPADVIMAEMREATLRKQAEESKVPYEVLKKQQEADERAERLEQEINQLRYQSWQTQIKSESTRLQEQYTMLTEEDFDQAVNYILNTAKNVDLPLEDAVFAVHGKKIVEGLSKAKVQDQLATESGRKKKTPLAPTNGKPASPAKQLTAEEKSIAKAFGMSEADYLKYKS